MGIIKNSITFGSGFNITAEGPIDSRMVVEYISDLTTVWNSDAPAYEGMSVSVLEDGNIYVLRNKDFSNFNNWKKQGSDGGSGIGEYSLPVMTEDMKNAALADPNSGFNNDSSYISVDDGSSLNGQTTNNNITSVNGTYLYIMMNTIRALQAEVAKLKNTFQYGIHSYNNEVTARSSMLDQYDETLMDEPLWALDPSMMSEVFDTADFKTELIPDNFTISSIIGEGSINASVPEQLTFVNGIGKFSDKASTLFNITDSKLVTYLVTSSKHVYFNLHTKDDYNHNRRVDISSFIEGDYNKYGIMLVLSRKVGEHGKNYVYISVMNYETNEKIVEGYLMPNADRLSFATQGSTVYEVSYRYSIESIEFVEQTLYRMKFYTKYEDFSEDVIPSAPDDDYTYKTAHLTIRSVRDSAMMERIKEQLHENELIWNVDKKELNIKSNNKIYKIGIVGSNDNNTNTEETMTPRELIEKLTQMGIIVNAQFDSDNNIINVDDLKLNDISEFSLINSDTEKKYTFTVDPHGKLIGRDESMKTIEIDLAKVFDGRNYEEKVAAMNSFLDVVDGSNSNEEYGWVRGFIPLYLNSLKGDNKWAPNGTSAGSAGDYGLLSDRLRISSFYAPLKTDIVHGCSHSFIELENTSDVDIPLEGVYLHFYRPAIDGVEDSNIVYHLALDGVIKSGSTYLVRGAQHAEMDDESTFIKVDSYDKEWYYKKKDGNGNVIDYGLVSFEQEVVATLDKGTVEDTVNNKVHGAYKFCLTYGLPNLNKDSKLIIKNELSKLYITKEGRIVDSGYNDDTKMEFSKSDFPNIIKNRRYIDGCGFSSFSGFAAPGIYDKECKKGDVTLCTGKWFCGGVTITENTMFRHMFALDPAKQAYNGWTTKDGSRTRYNKASDLQVVSLNKEYIGFPNSKEIVPINRYTPKASYENKNVMTDKSQLDREKPNMVTCSFGMDVYKTRCFNWISCGAFDEYLWVRKQGEENWKSFSSYTKKNTPMKYSEPNVDYGNMGDVDTFGYVGTLSNINVNGDLNLIDTISTYIRNGGNNFDSYKNTPVWCRLLKYIDNDWKIVYQSEEPKMINDCVYNQLHYKQVLTSDWNNVNVSDIPDDIKTILNDLPDFGQTNNGLDDNDIKSYTIPVECNKGYLKLTYKWVRGSHKINCVGVDVLKNDNVVGSDYHVGFTGNQASNNDYIIYIPEDGTYNVRFFAEQDREPLDSVCDLTVAYNVDLNPMLKFKMSIKDDANKYIGSNDKIAIVYVSDENAQAISSVRLGFKSINVNGGLRDQLTNNSSGTTWCPAFVIGHTPMMVKGDSENICRKEFIDSVNNAVYSRITSRFPGNNVLFTSHKVIIDLPEIEDDKPIVYEYVVGRADKDGNPDSNHTNEIYTFTLYPSSYEGRTYQITDQQGFHWIEYQVWAATAEKLNSVISEECKSINDGVDEMEEGVKVFPILINTGDMTQSGARINEWLDYYNGGKCLFNHMEQMNCVGNNDLCNIDPTILGTGNDTGKSNSKFFHYFYCYDIPNDDKLIVKAHDVNVTSWLSTTNISISEDRYIPSIYYFETSGVIYVIANSEITKTTCEKWFGLYGKNVDGETKSINLYTGIEIRADGDYDIKCQNDRQIFYPIYETLYSWLKNNQSTSNKKIIFACHEIPFTVITQASLSNSDRATMGYSRNYPNGSSSLLGSHMNQLDATENRGTYWISRLLEYFGCKLCIGGHKHTYALSYPIKENYQWVDKDNVEHNSSDGIKEMRTTLEDECGSTPENNVSWIVTTNKENGNPYNIYVGFNDDVDISSTKLPYIPNDLYENIGAKRFTEDTQYYYRCCTPITITNNSKYDGFVNYSMCQATGYKLKSNKELPCSYQVFSKLIPMTTNVVTDNGDGTYKFTDTVNGEQLYPMFSVLEIKHGRDNNISSINVKMCRVTGIFKANGKDSFTQTSYGTKTPSIQYLIEVNGDNVESIENLLSTPENTVSIPENEYMYGVWVSTNVYENLGLEEGNMNKYLYIEY